MSLPDSSSKPSAVVKALAIPELASTVFSTSFRRDLRSLACVSRYMFNIATPLLWRETTAWELLHLVKTVLVYPKLEEGVSYVFSLNHIHSTSKRPFERFHFYAPRVETLVVYENGPTRVIFPYHPADLDPYEVMGWDILFQEAKLHAGPLLPKLKSILFMQDVFPTHGLAELKRIAVFATHNLERLSLVPSHLYPHAAIPYAVASSILRELTLISPTIRTLELAASRNINSSPNPLALQEALIHQSSEPWYHHLKQLQKLRSLTLSEACLRPACFEIISSLPELASLSIIQETHESWDYDLLIEHITNIRVPDESFLNLTHLSLNGLELDIIEKLLSFNPLLFQVISLELRFWVDPNALSNYPDPDEEYATFWTLFSSLRGIPCLQELIAALCPSRDTGPFTRLVDQAGRMGVNTSLTHVYLGGMYFEMSPDYSCVPGLIRIWPNLQTLSIPSQPASIEELKSFAGFPKLLKLTVALDLDSPSSHTPSLSRSTHAPLTILASSGRVRLSDDNPELHTRVSELLCLWPSLQSVTWIDSNSARMNQARVLNQIIRGCQGSSSACETPSRPRELVDNVSLALNQLINNSEENPDQNTYY
ncbi:unnamed protein product [Rhizoctonia solani]|uniref:F-box domain-containing protein n=1 Tax=Rhizoctonia solani TaxID=456999 RepID=A0A8H3AT93_9AGAM|nr:unnamed protein product [Rhizoctonia solani]